MSSKAQDEGGGIPDAVKWAVAVVILGAGVSAYHVYPEASFLLRVVGVLVCTAIAIAIAGQTAKGQEAFGFIRGARTEVRKVVWPSRKETLQTTGMVFVVVVLVALALWALDSLLGWSVSQLLGWGG
ncbi:MAG: preprotein translocase subunit SecE [Hyphomicrobiaceae bacterium]|jgi:preprotein translocase subunit SecE